MILIKIISKHDTTRKILRNTKFKHGNLAYVYLDMFNVYVAINWKQPFILYGSIIDEDIWYKRKTTKLTDRERFEKIKDKYDFTPDCWYCSRKWDCKNSCIYLGCNSKICDNFKLF